MTPKYITNYKHANQNTEIHKIIQKITQIIKNHSMLLRVHDTRKTKIKETNHQSRPIHNILQQKDYNRLRRQKGMKDRENLFVLGLGITKGYELRVTCSHLTSRLISKLFKTCCGCLISSKSSRQNLSRLFANVSK